MKLSVAGSIATVALVSAGLAAVSLVAVRPSSQSSSRAFGQPGSRARR